MGSAKTTEHLPQSCLKRDLFLACVLFVAVAIIYGRQLEAEPYFADEGAMYAQSYYWRLYSAGQWNHPHWLVYPAFDHPPLSKYIFGISLQLHGLSPPGSLELWQRWMQGDFYNYDLPRIVACRVPVALAGAAGVAMMYLTGVLLQGRFTGGLAALLLASCPLYYTHARRAMGDVLAEAGTVATLAAALYASRRPQPLRTWLPPFAPLAGLAVFGALAPLAKLNGGMAPAFTWVGMIVVFLAAMITGLRPWHQLWILLLFPVLSFAIFTLLNPTLFARPTYAELDADPYRHLAIWRDEDPSLLKKGPIGRALYLVRFRAEAMRDGAKNFPEDQLKTFKDRVKALWYDGFGTYSPLAARRFRTGTGSVTVIEYGALPFVPWLWGPLVLIGMASMFTAGIEAIRTARLPAEWLVFAYSAGVLALLLLTLPLRWDRYFLPLQTVATLAVPFGIFRVCRWFWLGLILPPPVGPEDQRSQEAPVSSPQPGAEHNRSK